MLCYDMLCCVACNFGLNLSLTLEEKSYIYKTSTIKVDLIINKINKQCIIKANKTKKNSIVQKRDENKTKTKKCFAMI